MIMEIELRVGDRVHHVDAPERIGTVKRFPGYGRAVVEWESTGRESDENTAYLAPSVTVRVVPTERGSHELTVDGKFYGSFGEEANAAAAADHWTRYLASGGHPLTQDERHYSRRDTYPSHGITFREHLGAGGYLPDMWEVFHFGTRVGRYQTERGALNRIERLKNGN